MPFCSYKFQFPISNKYAFISGLNLININICPHANKKERIKDLKELLKDNDNDVLCLDNGTALKIDNNNIEIIYSIKTNQVKLLSNTKETIIDNSNIKKIINL